MGLQENWTRFCCSLQSPCRKSRIAFNVQKCTRLLRAAEGGWLQLQCWWTVKKVIDARRLAAPSWTACLCRFLRRVREIWYKAVVIYTGRPRRNVPDFGRVFLMLNYTDITQNTHVQSWTVTEIIAREKCGLLAGPHTVPVSWQSYPCQSLSVVSYDSSSPHARLIPECAVSLITSPLGSHLSCIVLGTLRTTMTWVRVFL